MMQGYAVVYAFVLMGIIFAAVTLFAAKLLRPSLSYARKLSTYECGMPAMGTTEVSWNIRFYVFALLFVIFDVEALFIFPWAVACKELGIVSLAEMAIFLAILFLGLAYAWAKGALVWE